MQCRKKCGACCIAPSISTPFLGMPQGKPPGVTCVHLDSKRRCRLFRDIRRPTLCDKFIPEKQFCGDSFQEAYKNLKNLEMISKTDPEEVII